MTLVLGIDLGITGARAALVDRAGRLLARGRSPVERTGASVAPADWMTAIVAAVRETCGDASPKIDAIGIGALGPCPVLLDAAGAAIADVPLFSTDTSAEAERQAMLRDRRLAPESLGPDHVLPRLAHWQRTQPDVMRHARLVVDVAGYVVAWLTGRPVMDPATRHDHVAEGLPQILPLPEILPATAHAGPLTARSAAALGLTAGTPVTAGAYDSYVDLHGAGVRDDGDAGLLLGSTMVLGVVQRAKPSPTNLAANGLRVTPYIGDTWFAGGWTSSSGSLLDWAGGFVSPNGAPLSLPAAHGLLALPYFAGERAPVWDPLARGAILGPTLATTSADIAAALRESVALSTLDIADRLAHTLGGIARYRVAGGGVHNAAWAQDTADALGRPLDVVANAGEAMGPALLALASLGEQTASPIERTISPDDRRHARYREVLDLYRGLYPALQDTLHSLGRLAGKEDTP